VAFAGGLPVRLSGFLDFGQRGMAGFPRDRTSPRLAIAQPENRSWLPRGGARERPKRHLGLCGDGGPCWICVRQPL